MAESTLFVVIDPSKQHQPALVRATDIIQQMGGRLHLFCCCYQEDLSDFSSRREAKRQTLHDTKALVEKLAEPFIQQGLPVEIEISWNQHGYQAAVHASARASADLIIKSSFSGDGDRNTLSRNSDYYLLRNAPCPVLLTGSAQSQNLMCVLAAIAIEDGDNEHDSLNNKIIAQAKRICRAANAELHVVAAVQGSPDIAQLLNILVDEEDEIASDQQLITSRFGVEADNVHIQSGLATDVIVATVQQLAPQLLVIGTLGRKGIKGAILGNTAEKILNQLEIDVLVIN